MIRANSPMRTTTAFAAAVNGHADATVAERMEPHAALPWNEDNGSKRKTQRADVVPHSGSAAPSAEHWLAFGPFRLCPWQRLLLEEGKSLRLGSRSFEILIALLERAGEVVSKQELIGRVWRGVAVEDNNLKVQVAALRRTLRDGQAGSRYICTITGRGYCFVAPLRRFAGFVDHALIDRPAVPAEAPNPIVYGCGRIDKPLLKSQHQHFLRLDNTRRQPCRSWRSATSEPVFDDTAVEPLPNSGSSLTSDEA